MEHHALYQYQLFNTRKIFMGHIQTETPYYQPNPPAPAPFTSVASLNDPQFSSNGTSPYPDSAWGLRIVDSQDILVYGAGLYSFFNNWSTLCSTVAAGESCQGRITSLEGNVTGTIYCLTTVGSVSMIDQNSVSLADWASNLGPFGQNIALFRP